MKTALMLAMGSLLGLALLSPARAETSSCTPEKWAEAIARFVQTDGGVVFMGSSSIHLWDLPKYFAEL